MVRIGMHEAKTQLSRLVDLARNGEDVVIQRSGQPVARLMPIQGLRPIAEAFGAMQGEIKLAPDFDELPDEFADHFR